MSKFFLIQPIVTEEHLPKACRTMEAPLRNIDCKNLTLESANKLTNMSSRSQDTTHFAVFFQMIQGSNPGLCFCYFNTEGRFHRISLTEGNYSHNMTQIDVGWKIIYDPRLSISSI